MKLTAKKFNVGWERNNLAATDWHPDGWRIEEADIPPIKFSYRHRWFEAGGKDMSRAELVEKIRAWQKRLGEPDDD